MTRQNKMQILSKRLTFCQCTMIQSVWFLSNKTCTLWIVTISIFKNWSMIYPFWIVNKKLREYIIELKVFEVLFLMSFRRNDRRLSWSSSINRVKTDVEEVLKTNIKQNHWIIRFLFFFHIKVGNKVATHTLITWLPSYTFWWRTLKEQEIRVLIFNFVTGAPLDVCKAAYIN